MPLNEADKAWVRQEIRGTFKRKGLGVIAGILKDWGGVGAAIAILIFALTRWESYTEFRVHTQDRLDSLGDAVRSIDEKLAALKLTEASQTPDVHRAKQAASVLADAKSRNLRIDPLVVNDTGVRFLNAAQKFPELWPTVNEYLNYTSFLASSWSPNPSDLTSFTNAGVYAPVLNLRPREELSSTNILAAQVFFGGGHVPNETGARLELLAQPQSHSSGVAIIVVKGRADTVVLDGQYMKSVVIRDAVVAYDGGPVRLENVYFVNCTFDVKRSPVGVNFAKDFLRERSVSFSA